MEKLQGLIIKAVSGFYYVEAADCVYECKARGSFRKKGIKPVAGDRVEIVGGAVWVNGYIVHIEEKYSSTSNQAGSNTQIEMNVTLLSRSVTYLGSDNNYKSTFIQ